MISICCDVIDVEILKVARFIARKKRTTVLVYTSTETLEVSYEKVSEMSLEKGKEE